MIKRRLSQIIICVAALLSSAAAQAASVHAGYCDGRLSERGYSKTGSGTISAAIILPKHAVTKYAGAKITAIRIGLKTTEGVKNLRGWVRESLETENIGEAAFSSPTEGWNEMSLSAPLSISGSDSIAIGYSFEQEKSVNCMSVAGDDNKNGYWVAKDGKWQNRSKDLIGSLSVEVVIEGESVPAKDLEIISLSTDNSLVKYGEDVVVSCVTRNSALSSLQDIVYSCSVNGNIIDQKTKNRQMEYRDRDTIVFTFKSDITPLGAGIPIEVTAETEGDEKEDNNVCSTVFSSYTESYPHKVLLEEFTTEHCPNCPRAIETIATVLEEGYEEKTVCVAHHSGYKYDWLTTEHDEGLEWLYGDDGTYAPAGMFDRTQNDNYGSETPVFSIGYPDTYRPMLDIALSSPAFVSMKPTATYDESSRTLQISVTAEKMSVFDYQCPEPRMNIYIIEDSILAQSQAGYNSSTFRHRHVFRESLTGQWGELMEWNGDSHTSQYTFVLPETWNARYILVVAFVSGYNPEDRNECRVFNSEEFELKPLTSSIANVGNSMKKVQRTDYYDINGTRLRHPSNGLYIKKTVFTDGTTEVKKCTSVE